MGVHTEKARDLESILHAVRQIPSRPERAAYLANACGGDDDLRERLERLLSTEAELDSFPGSEKTVEAPSGRRGRSSAAASIALYCEANVGSLIASQARCAEGPPRHLPAYCVANQPSRQPHSTAVRYPPDEVHALKTGVGRPLLSTATKTTSACVTSTTESGS